MKKNITKSQIERHLRLQEQSIFIQGNIIIGDPNETEETGQRITCFGGMGTQRINGVKFGSIEGSSKFFSI